jgi:hypothetical protein
MLVHQWLLTVSLRPLQICMLDPPQTCNYISSPQLIEALASVQQNVRSSVFAPTLKPLDLVDGENAHLNTRNKYEESKASVDNAPCHHRT